MISRFTRAVPLHSLLLVFLLFGFASYSSAAGTCGGNPLTISGPDAPTDGATYSVSGGKGPYSWCISKGSISQSGTVKVSGHCGPATVTVWDGCGNSGTKSIKIGGGWVLQNRTQQTTTCAGWGSTCGEAADTYCGGGVICPIVSIFSDNVRQDVHVATCANGGLYNYGCYWFPDDWALGWMKPGVSGGDTGLLSKAINQGNLTINTDAWLLYYDTYNWQYPATCTEQEKTCTVPPHNLTITSFTGTSKVINPIAGGAVTVNGSISDSYGSPVTWTIKLPNGQTIPGSGSTATATWDGKDTNGKVVPEGTSYPITLTAQSSCGCSDTKTITASVQWPPDGQCGLYVQFGSSAHLASGNLAHSQSLFSSKGGARPVAITLYYNSLDPNNGGLGSGWSHSYDSSLVQNSDGSVLLKEGNWQQRIYTLVNGSYVSQQRDYSTLARNADGTFVLTEKDGTVYTFGADGKITFTRDRNGNKLSFAYTNGNLTAVTDPAGRSASLTYDQFNHLTAVTDVAQNSYSFGYSNQMLTSVSYPDGGTWNYTYDPQGFMLTKKDPLGNSTSYGYDTNHRVVSSVDRQGNTRSVSYPQAGGTSAITTFTEKDGGVWKYSYDRQAGTLTQKVDPQGGVTSYGYDSNGNRTSATSPAGATVNYSYDGQGDMTSMTDAAGNTTTYSYNSYGQILSVKDSQGTTSYTYDANGNVASMTEPSGATTQYQYDGKGYVASITNAAGQTTSFTYDAGGNVASVTDPTGATSSNTYDASGNLVSETDTAGKTTAYTYDKQDHLLTATDPLGNTTTFTYDANGNKTSQTDANGNTTTYGYDQEGQLTKEMDALGNATSYAYSGTGCSSCGGGVNKLTSLTDAKGQTTNFQYNTLGQLTRETDPLQKSTAYGYDPAGNVAVKTDANGANITSEHDALNRLISKTYPDGSSVSYSYDAAGHVLTAKNAAVSYSYTYDAAGRMTGVTDSRGYTIAYKYDQLGNRTSMTLQPGTPDERVTTYAYDKANRLKSITSPAGTFTYGYDTTGRRISLSYPNGVVATYTYDDAGRLTALKYATATATIDSFTYTHDKVGNRTSNTTSEKEEYQYDPTYRLQKVHSSKAEAYAYDQVGNRQSGPGAKDTGYTHNSGNQMTQGRKLQYGYDDNGNQTDKRQVGAADRGWKQTWDADNRLIKVEKVKGAERRSVTFSYDAVGRRLGKQLTTVADGVTKTQTWSYVYDGNAISVEVSTGDNGAATRTFYTHGAGVDEHLALERDGQSYYYHQDGLGSVASITDTNSSVVQRYHYNSFGRTKPTTAFRNSYVYTGREWDKETGLYYYRARYYDPMEGRFISKDPESFAGGDITLYGYTQNNPINFTDPSGQSLAATMGGWASTWAGGGTSAVAGGGAAATAGAVAGIAGGLVLGIPSSIADEPDINSPIYKEKGSNWATEQAKSTAKATGQNPCDVLSKMLDEAKCKGDQSKINAIVQAQKFMGCRNIQKRNSN